MYKELKAQLLSRYMDTKNMLPCELEHQAADAIEHLERQLVERDAEIAKYRDAPVVAYEYRWLDMNPHTVTSGQWSEWERVLPRNVITTVDDHVAEIQYWIDKGYKYELRSLIVKPGEQ